MNESDYERMAERRRARQKKRRHQVLMMKGIILAVLVVVLVIASSAAWHFLSPSGDAKKNPKDNNLTASSDTKNTENTSAGETESETSSETETEGTSDPIAEARLLAAGYDYDGAIDLLKSVDSYESNTEIMAAIQEFETTKASCVAVDVTTVPHIFYHSLINDTTRAFDVSVLGQSQVDGMNAWMTTVEEFDKITQAMYDNGYVLIDLHDMVTETTDENGTVHFTTNQIMLPEGKKPFVLSLDDLSYYHSYDGRGVASKIVLDENGKPTCEYIQADGTTVTGAYDCIPLLDQFLEEHPDGAYHGARGTIALTGYNGILGYRTDIAYKTRENLTADQQAWLDAHPDFDYDKECEEAKKVADAIKADGWKFASHTWGHIRIGDASLESIQKDTEKWLSYVAPLVGGTDTIIFAHGQDLADWHDYSSDNAKFAYLKSQGFNFFCNVDSSQYFLQIRDNYVRQGRRNLDGYRLWNDVHGEKNRTSDLFDATQILDPARTDMPPL